MNLKKWNVWVRNRIYRGEILSPASYRRHKIPVFAAVLLAPYLPPKRGKGRGRMHTHSNNITWIISRELLRKGPLSKLWSGPIVAKTKLKKIKRLDERREQSLCRLQRYKQMQFGEILEQSTGNDGKGKRPDVFGEDCGFMWVVPETIRRASAREIIELHKILRFRTVFKFIKELQISFTISVDIRIIASYAVSISFCIKIQWSCWYVSSVNDSQDLNVLLVWEAARKSR